ncbi:MAG: hypothetical protein LBH92_01025 [Bacteroidales bacterium]|nr:hypothetical protein [Bacteroidales bacterium]
MAELKEIISSTLKITIFPNTVLSIENVKNSPAKNSNATASIDRLEIYPLIICSRAVYITLNFQSEQPEKVVNRLLAFH